MIVYNSETLKVYQSSFYTTTSSNKANPKVGDAFTITQKLTNSGHDVGKNTVLTYKVPRGLEFIKASVSTGKYTYNSKTRTLTWNIPSAKVGLSTLKIIMKVSGVSRYVVTPTTLNSETYAPSINNTIVQKK